MEADGRILHRDWDLYDTRHVVFRTCGMPAESLEAGYWRAYRDFYRWSSISRAGLGKRGPHEWLRHVAYAAGWKKFEPLWDWVIRAQRAAHMLPLLETILGTRASPSSRRPSDLDVISLTSRRRAKCAALRTC